MYPDSPTSLEGKQKQTAVFPSSLWKQQNLIRVLEEHSKEQPTLTPSPAHEEIQFCDSPDNRREGETIISFTIDVFSELSSQTS